MPDTAPSNVVGVTVPSQAELPEGVSVQKAVFQHLMERTEEDILRIGQKATYATLVAKAITGEATHQELAILRNLLKDNGLTLGIPPESDPRVVTPEEDIAHIPDFEEPDHGRP